MLDKETKRKINSARDILVGKIPDPTAQVDQITTALIYKFMDDMDQESKSFGGKPKFFTGDFKKYSWPKIIDIKLSGQERMDLYIQALSQLPRNEKWPPLFREIFKNAFLPYRDAETLSLFLKEINAFSYEHSENLGNAFEYLLSILGSQGDAGQFRTPRHIIDFIVEVADPRKEESILDPACGTAGFLISAYKHIVKHNSGNYDPEKDSYSFAFRKSTESSESSESTLFLSKQSHSDKQPYDLNIFRHSRQNQKTNQPAFQSHEGRDPEIKILKHYQPFESASAVQIQSNGGYKGEKLLPKDKKHLQKNIIGYDISPKMVKLSLVNMYLHNFNTPHIYEYDTLTSDNRWENDFDVILANPPFMSPKGGIRPHNKFSIQANRSEVLFVDYIAEHLTINGRAGVIVPEGVIFKNDKAYKALRKMLVEDGFLWAVVSLPAKVFEPYSGVKTSILFFDKKRAKSQKEILFVDVQNDGYDLGATRRENDKNDLPEAFKVLKSYSQGKRLKSAIAHYVRKTKIAERGDYNLTGSRYKVDIYSELQSINKYIKELSAGFAEVQLGVDTAFKPFRKQIIRAVKSKQNSKTQTVDQNIEKQTEISALKLNKTLEKIEKRSCKKAQGSMVNLYLCLKNLIHSTEFLHSEERVQDIVNKLWGSAKVCDLKELWKLQPHLEPLLKQKYPLVELGEVCDIFTGNRPKGGAVSKGILSIGGEHINSDGGFNLSKPKYIPEQFFNQMKRGKLQSGDVLIVKDGATTGKTGYFNEKSPFKKGAVNEHVFILRSHTQKIEPYYLYQVLKSKEGNIEILRHKTGSAQGGINLSVKGIKIPLPPFVEQKKIVVEIEDYQKIIESARQIVKTWKPIIKPDPSWPTVRLGEVCEFNPKKSEIKTVSKNQFVSFVPMVDLNTHDINFKARQKKKLNKVYTGYTYFAENDVLLARVTPCFENGKSGIAKNLENGIGFGSSEFFVYRADSSKILPEIIYYFISSKLFIDNGKKHMSGTGGLQRLTKDYATKYKIPLPPLEEQKKIVAELEQERMYVESCKKLIKLNEAKIQQTISEVWKQK